MRLPNSADRLRHLLLAAIGTCAFAPGCGDATRDSPTGGSECTEPTPWPTSDESGGGYVRCADGIIHRPEAGACSRPATPGTAVTSEFPFVGDCQLDTDCTEMPNGFCQTSPGLGPEPGSSVCAYPCTTDADCAEGRTCSCEEQGGRCLPATCRTDEDCAGELCVRLPTQTVCGRLIVPTLSCTSKTTECAADSNCALGQVCVAGSCMQGGNSCGRPFLVQGAERRALAQAREDWSTPPYEPAPAMLSPRAKAILCEHFTQAALMEHASIAAFARFSLQLLALGAPAELVERAARAMADETEHARVCFALATRYGGESVGPGALSIQGCLDGSDPVLIFATAFREACIGETLAALEALEAAEGALEPALRATLTRIAEDEARHAELGWRFASWMLETSEPGLRAELLSVLAALTDSELEPRCCAELASESPDRAALSQHGLLSASARARVRDAALREVVVPCSDSLLRQYDVLPARTHQKSASLMG